MQLLAQDVNTIIKPGKTHSVQLSISAEESKIPDELLLSAADALETSFPQPPKPVPHPHSEKQVTQLQVILYNCFHCSVA